MLHPQEIEVRFIIPAVRRELFVALSENHNLSQRKIARLMNITEAAVSQYKKEKRGKHAKLPGHIRSEISTSAENIYSGDSVVFNEIQRLLGLIRKDLTICQIHQLMDSDVPSDCKECLAYL